jgi:hypothetical protein
MTKSALGFGWAMQVLAYSEMMRLIKGGDTIASANTLDVLTRAAEKCMDGISGTLFNAGEALQSSTVDRMTEAFSPYGCSVWRPVRQGLEIFEQAAGFFRRMAPGDANRLAWLEVRNKGEVYILVEDLAAIVELDANESLSSMVEKAYGLSEFQVLWGIEGVGHYYADCQCPPTSAPLNLLAAENTLAVPSQALLMLHAGMGLSFADRFLGQTAAALKGRDLAAQVSKFVHCCVGNSQFGYEGAALEALGLVARVLYPSMVRPIDRILRQSYAGAVGYFWHGVGRALYFAPASFLPFLDDPWQHVESESIDEISLQNVTAGLAWAVALVNMRQPEIIESVLAEKNIHSQLAFSNGVASSSILREDLTPGASFLESFVRFHTVKTSNQGTWDKLIRIPCERGLNEDYPTLKRAHRLGELFQYRPVARDADGQETLTVPLEVTDG